MEEGSCRASGQGAGLELSTCLCGGGLRGCRPLCFDRGDLIESEVGAGLEEEFMMWYS